MERRGPHVDRTTLAAFEARIGTTIPEGYADFLLDVNGGRMGDAHRVFSIVIRGQPNGTVLNSLFSLGDPKEVNNLEERWELSRNWLPPELIPIGYDDRGSILLAIGGPHRGEIWFLDREGRPEGSNPRVEWFDRRDVCRIALSFSAFLEMLRPLD